MKKTYYRLSLGFVIFISFISALLLQSDIDDKGTVMIHTKPGDARVYVNGVRKGNSPAMKEHLFAIKLKEGKYTVEAIKDTGSHLDEYYGKKEVVVSKDNIPTITIKLSKRPSKFARNKMLESNPSLGNVIEPEMVKIPGGAFSMGCVSGKSCDDDEKPVHNVRVSGFEIGKYETTFDQWDACVAQGGCDHMPKDSGWGRGNRPVMGVSWVDVQQYIKWLNQKTDKNYRLPSEAEWEYSARSGSATEYPWGDKLGRNNANCKYCGNSTDLGKTVPVGAYPANGFGLHEMQGNVNEWIQDCANINYRGAPVDGSAWLTGDCAVRVVRGGSWQSPPTRVRSASRGNGSVDDRINRIGFRLARDLDNQGESIEAKAPNAHVSTAEQGTARIITDSNADDVNIYVNDKYVGKTTTKEEHALVIKLNEGEYRITAQKPFKGTKEYFGGKKIYLAGDTIQTVIVELDLRPNEAARKKIMDKYKDSVPEPEMIKIPGGSFSMGCLEEKYCRKRELPAHKVQLPAFELSKYEITFRQWAVCVAFEGCDHFPYYRVIGEDNHPIIDVSWDDAQQYIRWLNKKTGKNYRLPTEAEWEYAARAGTTTKYFWGDDVGSDNASCSECSGKGREKPALVGSYAANAFGLYDMHGNAMELTQDCVNTNYEGAPADGSAWESGDCSRRIQRGGSWENGRIESSYRGDYPHDYRSPSTGLRLARDIH